MRAERLDGDPANPGGSALQVPIIAETDLHSVLETIAVERPEVCVIDSVQTLRSVELSGAPGSVGQVREVAAQLPSAPEVVVLDPHTVGEALGEVCFNTAMSG